jgi:ribonuclease HI
MKGQVVADFIVDHAVDVDHSVNFVKLKPWGLYFDGSVCSKGQGARCVIISPEFACTNNQVEYESLLHGLEYLRDLGARDVDVFGYSNLIMQQIKGDCQCLDGVLNFYQDWCLYIIMVLDMFTIKHIPQEENSRAYRLAQQALDYVVSQGVFWVASVSLVEHRYALRSKGKPVLVNSNRLQDEEKPILDKTNQLPVKIGPYSGITELELGKTMLGSGKAELEWGKIELEQGCEIGLREEAKPTLV